MSDPKAYQNQYVVAAGGEVRVMAFEPTVASLDGLIAGLKTSIAHGPHFVDHNAAALLLLAELLKQALEAKANP